MYGHTPAASRDGKAQCKLDIAVALFLSGSNAATLSYRSKSTGGAGYFSLRPLLAPRPYPIGRRGCDDSSTDRANSTVFEKEIGTMSRYRIVVWTQ